MLCRYAGCRCAKCLYAGYRYAECHYAGCHYAECRGPILQSIVKGKLAAKNSRFV